MRKYFFSTAVICALVVQVLPVSLFAQAYNVKAFGALADGKTLNTRFIQSAIDKCAADGGGKVLFPAGVFYTGTIFLRSNVYLELLPGAVLQGSYDPADYPDHDIYRHQKFGTITHDGLYVKYMKALVVADSVNNIGIIGEGTIKGPGEGKAFQLGLNKDGKPKNIFFIGCRDVKLKDVHVLNSAQITISISGCERVMIEGITIKSLVNWNCDGLDVDARDVTIANCIIESEDDALCFKSEYLDKFCENISVNNCVVASICNGIKLGTGSRTGFRNITVNNCVIRKTNVDDYFHWKMTGDIVYKPGTTSVNTGIVILGVDGGTVENIHFSNITMTDVISPIFVRVGKRFLSPEQRPSVMRNVSIQQVTAESRSIIPSIIAGLEESPVNGIRLSDISISIPITVSEDALKSFPTTLTENTKGYPENRLVFGTKLPSSAFYVRHVDGIVMKNISVNYAVGEARPAFYFDDTREVDLNNITVNRQHVNLQSKMIHTKKSVTVITR